MHKQDHTPLITKIVKDYCLLQKCIKEIPEYIVANLDSISDKNAIQEYITQEELLSSLLTCSILCKKHDLVEKIMFSIDNIDVNKLLTKIDQSGYSPISCTLYSGSYKIQNLIKNYIDKHEMTIQKATLEGDDFYNILTVLEFSQFEDMDVDKCLKEYIKPLYDNESVQKIQEELYKSNDDELVGINLSESFDFNDLDISNYESSIYVLGDYSDDQ